MALEPRFPDRFGDPGIQQYTIYIYKNCIYSLVWVQTTVVQAMFEMNLQLEIWKPYGKVRNRELGI